MNHSCMNTSKNQFTWVESKNVSHLFHFAISSFCCPVAVESLDDPSLLPSVPGDASLPVLGFRGAAGATVCLPNIQRVVPPWVPQGVGGCHAARAGSQSPPHT